MKSKSCRITEAQRSALLDLSSWPHSLSREESDEAIIQALAPMLISFLTHLIEQGRAIGTLRRHRNNLHLLADEVLTEITQFPEDPPLSVSQALANLLSDDEGPMLNGGSDTEAEQRSFDTTCGLFCRHINVVLPM
jgi:hypothetical protein